MVIVVNEMNLPGEETIDAVGCAIDGSGKILASILLNFQSLFVLFACDFKNIPVYRNIS